MSHPREAAVLSRQAPSGVRWLLACLAWVGIGSATAQETDLDAVRVRAEEHYLSGRWEEALSDFERLVSLFPEEGCLHGRLAGCALHEPGRLAVARRHLRIAVRKGCSDVDLEFHRARLAQLEYAFDRAADLYAAYLAAAGKKARFGEEARTAVRMCQSVVWSPDEAVGLQVLDRIPADPKAAFRFYRPGTPGLRLVSVPTNLRSKADLRESAGRMAFHDGDTLLVYGSLGKKGQRGWDLYAIALRGGEYGDPVLLGDSVNTEFNERDAFLSRDGILYFSSDRPGGLGGYDIYAAPWSDGAVSAAPQRLPYPINSVNDDAFFIPEPDGGAWFASDRAASEGRVHAFRVALSEAPFAGGTVAWVAEEAEQSGLSLRVFQHGEMLDEVTLSGQDAEHIQLEVPDADAGVRVVLVDRQGEIVAESFGAAMDAWEIRKEGRGWNLAERVQPDWAMMADLQPATGKGSGPSLQADDNSAAESDGTTGPLSWATWVESRIPESATTGTSESMAVAQEATQPAQEADAEVVRSVDGGGGTEAASEDAGFANSGIAETEVRLMDNTAEAWSEQVPDPETLAQLKSENPALVQEVWTRNMQQVLVLEKGFLDNPSMALAGAVFDAIDLLEGWEPDAALVDPLLADAVDFEDVRSMLDEWSAAVQSATKASLAKVAGDAALAFRREKLALRELKEAGAPDLGQAQRQWSNHLDARRGVPGADDADAEWTVEQGDALFEDVSEALERSGELWSRKARAGWRGDWAERQRNQWEAQRTLWEAERDEVIGLSTLADSNAPVGEGAGVQVSQQAGFIPVDDPLGQNGMEALLGHAFDGWNVTGAGDQSMQDMAAAVQDVGAVRKAWERFIGAVGDNAVPRIQTESELASLEPRVADRWVDLRQAMLTAWERHMEEEVSALNLLADDAMERFSASGALAEDADWLAFEEARRTLMEGANAAGGSEKGELVDRWVAQEAAFDTALQRSEARRRAESLWAAHVERWQQSVAAEEEAAALAVAEEQAARKAAEAEAAALAAAEEQAAREAAEAEAAALAAAEEQAAREAAEAEAAALAAAEEQAAREAAEAEAAALAAAEEQAAREAAEAEAVALAAAEEQAAREAAEAEAAASGSSEATAVALGAAPFPNSWAPDLKAEWFNILTEASEWSRTSTSEASASAFLPEDEALVAAWQAWLDGQTSAPDATASSKRRNQWEKEDFLAEKRLRSALQEVDIQGFRMRLADWQGAASSNASTALQSGDPDSAPRRTVGAGIAASVRSESEPSSSVDDVAAARARSFGVVLGAAEVVGAGARPEAGVRLRPVQREDMERAILSQWAEWTEDVDRAASAFSAGAGAPRAEGVEYKVQIGAFRNPLPAALFAAFDPMWAKTSASGITRYMAGSFDAYDPAVVARDAIRAMGYTDAFVVRFVDGERARGARPAPEDLAEERAQARTAGMSLAAVGNAPVEDEASGSNSEAGNVGVAPAPVVSVAVPTRPEDIETWSDIQGRVYSVQVGAFRGVPDQRALAAFGKLTREDAGADGWLRLFSGRFDSEGEARSHLSELQQLGRTDAFVVVYINGRRIPLLEASTTATGGMAVLGERTSDGAVGASNEAVITPSEGPQPQREVRWQLQLGAYSSTIPVRLANAILDAPLDWEVQSIREGGLTRYVTRTSVEEDVVQDWLSQARVMGFEQSVVLSLP